jgi:Domain of unknown function (DUF222)/HNH endonuclease
MCTNGDPLPALVSALDALVEADASQLAGGDAVVSLHRQVERLEAVATRAVGAFDRGHDWEVAGARTASSWVAVECSLPVRVARRRVQVGRALRDLPVAEAAWLAGEVSGAAVGLLTDARTEVTAEAMARDEAMLVDHAGRLSHGSFAKALAYWRQRADPDGVEDDAEALRAGRRVHLSSTYEGRWVLDGVLDPVGGEIVGDALGRVADELFERDWAEARAEHGEATTKEHLARTPAQRRADALVELARRAGAATDGRVPEPLFTVHVDHETLLGRLCELASGTVVTPGSLLPWVTEARVERVVFDGTDRVLGVGRRRRFFTGAERRAVEVRDRQCTNRWCEEPAERCEVDHVIPWALGGPTEADNGQLACGYHNRLRERAPP